MRDLFEVHVRLKNATESNVVLAVANSTEKVTAWIKETNPGAAILTVRKRAVTILEEE